MDIYEIPEADKKGTFIIISGFTVVGHYTHFGDAIRIAKSMEWMTPVPYVAKVIVNVKEI